MWNSLQQLDKTWKLIYDTQHLDLSLGRSRPKQGCIHLHELPKLTSDGASDKSATPDLPIAQFSGTYSAARVLRNDIPDTLMEIYPKDWRYRLTAGLINIVAIGICIGALMLFGPMLGIHGFLPVILAAVVGVVLGNLVIRRLVRPPSASPPEPPPREP